MILKDLNVRGVPNLLNVNSRKNRENRGKIGKTEENRSFVPKLMKQKKHAVSERYGNDKNIITWRKLPVKAAGMSGACCGGGGVISHF